MPSLYNMRGRRWELAGTAGAVSNQNLHGRAFGLASGVLVPISKQDCQALTALNHIDEISSNSGPIAVRIL